MKVFSILSILLLLINGLHGQNRLTVIVRSEDRNEPLAGASVFLKNSGRSAIADSNGIAIFENAIPGKPRIIASHLGYKTKELEYPFPLSKDVNIEVRMEPLDGEMNQVIVSSTRNPDYVRDVPTRIEVLSKEELDEKATMKPGDIRMLLNESTGIATQQTSATSGTANIRIGGLDGRYTQILKDGMPLYSGFAEGLSILQIAPLDLKQVEYIKGSGSTLYGGGAISGIVNLITKTPSPKGELNFMLNKTSAKGLDLNGFFGKKWEKIGVTVFSSYNENGAYDPASIGFSAIPKTGRFTCNPKIFIYANTHNQGWFAVNSTIENRLGGDMQVIGGKADTVHQYFEKNQTQRLSTQLLFVHIIDAFSQIEFKNSIGVFHRALSIPAFDFQGNQLSSFSELNYNHHKNKTAWVFGLNEWSENFMPMASTKLHYYLATIGIFGQNTWTINHFIKLESGLRVDNNSPSTNDKLRGWFVMPRINVLLKFNEELSSRIGGGMGYKMPTPFLDDAEKIDYQNVQSIDFAQMKSETSYGANADFTYQKQFDEIGFSLNEFFFYNRLDHPILLQNISFVNAHGFIDTKGAETNLKINFDDLSFYLGYTFTDARQHYNGLLDWLPLSARNRLNFDLSYEIENSFRFGFESFYTGKQKLSDGSFGQSYITFGLLLQKTWKHFDIFINGENLTDRRQTRWGNLYSGSITQPTFQDIYTPIEGIVLNGGIKLKW